MRKLIATLYTGYVGSDGHEAFCVEHDAAEDEINDIVYDMALNHAEKYGYYPYPEDDDDIDAENHGYSFGIEGTWEDYVPEEHDRYRPGGGSFEQDFR